MDIPKSVKRLFGNKKGDSRVISTIIIVGIVITINIAVAPYLTSVTGTFTRFERLDVTSAYADTYNGTYYVSSISVKNSGTSILTVDRVLVNGKPQNFNASWTPNSPANATTSRGWYILDGSACTGKVITIVQCDTGTINLYLSKNVYKSGQSLELTFHGVGGKEYPEVVVIL